MSVIGKEEVMHSSVLIIHSGGDSRRAPLNTVCGKAWATLNCHVSMKSTTSEPAACVANPILLLVQELSQLVRGMDTGIVIASSDVVLDIEVGLLLFAL